MFAASPIPDWAAAFAPPPHLTVSEWADAHRILPEASAARGARWRTAAVPYMAGVMNVIHEPTIRKVAVMTASQVGKSEAINNVLGYCMQHDPCPMLLVHPTAMAAEAYSKERLSDMIRSTPALRGIVQEKRVMAADGRPESTLSLKMFPGGFLALGGSNTPNTFARWSVRLAIGDDVDRFPAVVGEEGDPGELLVNRTTTFHDRLAIFVSTPTLKGGRIDTLWSQSDQRRYHVACPGCGRVDWITWNDPTHFRVVFDEQDPQTARFECPDADHGGCGTPIWERDRQALVASGTWHATAEPTEPGLAGFHVPGMLSPWVTLSDLVEKFLTARSRGREHLKVFINTLLGEAWEDRTQRMEAHRLMAHVEDYGTLQDGAPVAVPAPAVALTAGVDVQQDGFLMLVCGWGPAAERWVVDWRMVPGDPKRAETRAALLEALAARYAHATGLLLPIHATCIDSGYATEAIYDFVLQYQARRIFATKGIAGRSGEPIVGKAAAKTWGRTVRPVRLFPVNVDDAKAGVLASLALPIPGPNSTHFPARVESVDAEFFAQLCAEHQETRYAKSGVATHQVWVQDREANHALDAMVLASAAVLLLRPNLRDMAARIAEAAARPAAAEVPRPPTPNPPLPRPDPGLSEQTGQRRVRRSSYLQRSRIDEW